MHLLNKGLIRLEDAMAASTRPNDLALKLKGIRSVSRNDHSAEKHLNVDETQAAKLDLETLVTCQEKTRMFSFINARKNVVKIYALAEPSMRIVGLV